MHVLQESVALDPTRSGRTRRRPARLADAQTSTAGARRVKTVKEEENVPTVEGDQVIVVDVESTMPELGSVQ